MLCCPVLHTILPHPHPHRHKHHKQILWLPLLPLSQLPRYDLKPSRILISAQHLVATGYAVQSFFQPDCKASDAEVYTSWDGYPCSEPLCVKAVIKLLFVDDDCVSLLSRPGFGKLHAHVRCAWVKYQRLLILCSTGSILHLPEVDRWVLRWQPSKYAWFLPAGWQ